MNEIVQLLQKQAQWQRSRKDLSWPEKIRLAEKIRESAVLWRKTDGEGRPPFARPKVKGRRDGEAI